MVLTAGTMRRRVTIEKLSEQSLNAFGESVQTADQWTVVRTVWAGVMAVSAREAVQSERTQNVITYKVRMRTQPDLTTKHRLRWQGGVLNIQSILLRGNRLEEQEVLCAEQVD
jgi:SPP1 family predicted phage head-tail adaptor